jgi:hypothetical protein
MLLGEMSQVRTKTDILRVPQEIRSRRFSQGGDFNQNGCETAGFVGYLMITQKEASG